MKLTIAALALVAMINAPAFAKTVNGCEIVQVEGTNYFNLADPTCVMTDNAKGLGDAATATLADLFGN